MFRMTYLHGPHGHDYKHLYFEAEQAIATEIVDKVKNILELKFSPVRKEFVFTQVSWQIGRFFVVKLRYFC